jgi:2-keto-4-pentenoate hydratase/2-oxohepta-3-ene-1,7-dioic acid hydratase in catechol pathway
VKLAVFDDSRLGLVTPDQATVTDVTGVLPWPHDADPLSGWWRCLCRDFEVLAPRLRAASGPRRALSDVQLRAPVLGPSKVLGCAVNYPEHASEMRETVMPRTGTERSAWMLQFDVFLKAPSSIIGPREEVVLPDSVVRRGGEVHHECELALVIGRGGARIAEADAMRHVLGYTIGLDITERGPGDRSRRKSWDTFSPLGPWITTADEVPDPHELTIHLEVDGTVRQHASTRDMLVRIPAIISYASGVMRLEPGDVILTGAPHGVGQVHDGEAIEASIEGLGRMRIPVVRAGSPRTPVAEQPAVGGIR